MVRLYCDMIGDLFHAGHISFLRKVRALGEELGPADEVHLIVGLTNDGEAGPYKRRPILSMQERCDEIRACRYVDEVLPSVPLVTGACFMEEHRIEYLVHGDDYSEDQVYTYYSAAIESGRYKTVPYTAGISTSELIRRCAERHEEMGGGKAGAQGGAPGAGRMLMDFAAMVGFKAAIIIAAICLYCSLSICLKLSQVEGRYLYSSATVVLCTETAKAVLSFGLLYRSIGAAGARQKFAAWTLRDSYPFIVPGALYAFNNNLEFVVLRYLDIARFSAMSNLKIMSTGLLFRFFLKRKISPRQWLALVLLTCGATLAEYKPPRDGVVVSAEDESSYRTGVMLTLLYCTISGFAGCYNQYILQTGESGQAMQESIHFQNVQLYSYGIVFNAVGIWLKGDLGMVLSTGFFTGYNAWTWTVVLNLSCIGLVLSAVMKYADVLIKVFTTAGAMVASTILARVFFGFVITPYFISGVALITASVYLYSIKH